MPTSLKFSVNNQTGFVPIFFVIGLLVIGTLSIGTLMFFRSSQPKVAEIVETNDATTSAQEVPATLPEMTSDPGTCDASCQAYIDIQIKKAKDELLKSLQSSKSTGVTPLTNQTNQTIQSDNQPKEIYVSFGAGGSTSLTDWTNVSGSTISFNPSNYPGAKGFYFQANLKTDAPDRIVYARIYDTTHSVGVINSDIQYTGAESTFKESTALTFLSGAMTLKVQIHSLNGNLAVIENPRIKVAY